MKKKHFKGKHAPIVDKAAYKVGRKWEKQQKKKKDKEQNDG